MNDSHRNISLVETIDQLNSVLPEQVESARVAIATQGIQSVPRVLDLARQGHLDINRAIKAIRVMRLEADELIGFIDDDALGAILLRLAAASGPRLHPADKQCGITSDTVNAIIAALDGCRERVLVGLGLILEKLPQVRWQQPQLVPKFDAAIKPCARVLLRNEAFDDHAIRGMAAKTLRMLGAPTELALPGLHELIAKNLDEPGREVHAVLETYAYYATRDHSVFGEWLRLLGDERLQSHRSELIRPVAHPSGQAKKDLIVWIEKALLGDQKPEVAKQLKQILRELSKKAVTLPRITGCNEQLVALLEAMEHSGESIIQSSAETRSWAAHRMVERLDDPSLILDIGVLLGSRLRRTHFSKIVRMLVSVTRNCDSAEGRNLIAEMLDWEGLDEDERICLIKAATCCNVYDAADTIVRWLKDDPAAYQLEAYEFLGQLGTESAVTSILETASLLEDKTFAISALCKSQRDSELPESAIDFLIQLDKEADPQNRSQALVALGEIGLSDSGVTRHIERVLKESGRQSDVVASWIRHAALFALAERADPASLAVVYSAAQWELESGVDSDRKFGIPATVPALVFRYLFRVGEGQSQEARRLAAAILRAQVDSATEQFLNRHYVSDE